MQWISTAMGLRQCTIWAMNTPSASSSTEKGGSDLKVWPAIPAASLSHAKGMGIRGGFGDRQEWAW